MARRIKTATGSAELFYRAKSLAGPAELRTRTRNGVFDGGAPNGRVYPSGIGPSASYGPRASQNPTVYTVLVNPGTDLNAVCAAQASNAVIALAAGKHQLTDIDGLPALKAGQTLHGFTGAIITGSTVLNGTWTAEGSLLWHPHTSRLPAGPTEAVAGVTMVWTGYERANDPNEVYRNGERMRHMTTKAAVVAAGQSFFDHTTQRVYVHSASAPASSTMEIPNVRRVINQPGGATLKNLTIECVGNIRPADTDGNQPAVLLTNGLVEFCEFRLIHALAVQHSNSPIRYSRISHIGHLGVGGNGSGSSFLFEYNELAYCNESYFKWDFEAGGSKWAFTGDSGGSYDLGIRARYNWAHHNRGLALWIDVNNYSGTFEGNVAEDNEALGIFLEYSYGGRIWNNISRFNGTDVTAGGRLSNYAPNGANIAVSATNDASVLNNISEGGTVCLYFVDDHRRLSPRGVVKGNKVIARGGTRACYTMHTGQGTGLQSAIDWNENEYILDTLSSKFWDGTWEGGNKNWDQWRAIGRDLAGTAVVG